MRTVDPGSQSAGGPRDDLQSALAIAAVLVDPVRRRIFQVARRARRPVTRDEAASAAHVSRSLAAFHLDKLVEAGLLRASIRSSTGAGRVGRRPKVYEIGPAEVHLDVPRRQHGLLADVLVDALHEDDSGRVRRAATEAANRHGRTLGRAARAEAGGAGELARARTIIEGLGFDPYEAETSALRLATCPFQPLARESPELVCGLNLSLLAGLLDGLRVTGVEAVLAPRSGECCVELRPAPTGAPVDPIGGGSCRG